MFKQIILGTLLALASAGAANATPAATPEPEVAQLGLCGVFVRTDVYCNESVPVDTRQLQTAQIFIITLAPQAQEQWQRLHRERRRGITYTRVNEQGVQERVGRPAMPVVFRIFMQPPPGSHEEPFLAQGMIHGSSLVAFLPGEGDFAGWSAFVISTEGERGLTTSGEVIRMGGRHRRDGHFSLDLTRLPSSLVPNTLFVRRGDGSNLVEELETTFSDHVVIRDRDGGTRVYSGLPGTFTPLSEGGTTIVAMFTNCRRADQRLMERGNLRLDSTTAAGLLAGPVGLIRPAIQIFQNLRALAGGSCRG